MYYHIFYTLLYWNSCLRLYWLKMMNVLTQLIAYYTFRAWWCHSGITGINSKSGCCHCFTLPSSQMFLKKSHFLKLTKLSCSHIWSSWSFLKIWRRTWIYICVYVWNYVTLSSSSPSAASPSWMSPCAVSCQSPFKSYLMIESYCFYNNSLHLLFPGFTQTPFFLQRVAERSIFLLAARHISVYILRKYHPKDGRSTWPLGHPLRGTAPHAEAFSDCSVLNSISHVCEPPGGC